MNIENITSQNRRKYKRAANALIRDFNNEIKKDWLWNGRFEIAQNWSLFHPYEDHSGALYFFGAVITDKKTGRKEYNYFDNYGTKWQLWVWVNKCITETWDVWSENPNPNKQARLEGRTPPEC